ncbi:MAG: zinc dependent phospholipase C family protein [Lachnospiraceae bacterium]|nr:zinc dependent phospholipase C family protein [Lachnospiraceae bacterium]
MPAVFAHDLFGRMIESRLSGEKRRLIRRNKDCFYLGLQGPDPLFFYRPSVKNAIRLTGNSLHAQKSTVLFEDGISAIIEARKAGNSRQEEAFLSYLMGFVCHFALDSSLHGFINYQDRFSGFSHTALETELDRTLLLKEGYEPFRTVRASHLKITRDTVMAMSRIFGVPKAAAVEMLASMKLFNRLFVNASEATKQAVCFLIRPVKEYQLARGMFMWKTSPEGCGELVAIMERMFYQALPTGERLVNALWESVQAGAALPKRFDQRFG